VILILPPCSGAGSICRSSSRMSCQLYFYGRHRSQSAKEDIAHPYPAITRREPSPSRPGPRRGARQLYDENVASIAEDVNRLKSLTQGSDAASVLALRLGKGDAPLTTYPPQRRRFAEGGGVMQRPSSQRAQHSAVN
jgi:hypothetical protein